jgi:hypothetical protein
MAQSDVYFKGIKEIGKNYDNAKEAHDKVTHFALIFCSSTQNQGGEAARLAAKGKEERAELEFVTWLYVLKSRYFRVQRKKDLKQWLVLQQMSKDLRVCLLLVDAE